MKLKHLKHYGDNYYLLNDYYVYKVNGHYELPICDGTVSKDDINEFIDMCEKDNMTCIIKDTHIEVSIY
jgi:hypothetical protein